MRKKVLKDLSKGKLTVKEAYDKLYGQKPNHGDFVILRVHIKDHPGVSIFVNTLFFFPLPIVLAKPFLKRALRKGNIPESFYDDIIKYSGGTLIKVENKEANIYIKII